MRPTRAELAEVSARLGFPVDDVERASRILEVLAELSVCPELRDVVALKGGTAINLFEFEMPRLSIDIDLNLLGPGGRAEADAALPGIVTAVERILRSAGVLLAGPPRREAALVTWRGRYEDRTRRRRELKVELARQFRVSLEPVVRRDAKLFPQIRAVGVPVVGPHELAAGKIVALLDRRALRDAYDVPRLLAHSRIDRTLLRKLVVVLSAGTQSLDLRVADLRRIDVDVLARRDDLASLLPASEAPTTARRREWVAALHAACVAELHGLFPLREDESAFLTSLLDRGEVRPELLDVSPELRELVHVHPVVVWRARNAKDHNDRIRRGGARPAP